LGSAGIQDVSGQGIAWPALPASDVREGALRQRRFFCGALCRSQGYVAPARPQTRRTG
jgi:hypothetical protein